VVRELPAQQIHTARLPLHNKAVRFEFDAQFGGACTGFRFDEDVHLVDRLLPFISNILSSRGLLVPVRRKPTVVSHGEMAELSRSVLVECNITL
jgi:hypothetical protein